LTLNGKIPGVADVRPSITVLPAAEAAAMKTGSIDLAVGVHENC
jgi:hypothetical protein